MAPVPSDHPVRYPPLILAAGHISAIIYCTYAVGDSLYTSYRSLGPVLNTRSRIHLRRKLAPIFTVLAATAFTVATYYATKSATLSYRTWAHEHDLDFSQRSLVNGKGGYLPESRNSTYPYIKQWLSDTPIYHDALEIVAEKSRRFWWGQQIDLGTLAFSLMLATEGRRRQIPLRTAFLALAHLVNLSFAQNLFFLALLLTPSPLSSEKGHLELPVAPISTSTWTRFQNRLFPPKPNGWAPSARLQYSAITLHLGLMSLLPYTTGTSAFTTVALLTRASTFLPTILPKVVPVSWGSIQQGRHSAQGSPTGLFKFLSTGAFILHAKTTIIALIANAPNSHYHRHSVILPWDVEERTLWERSTNAFGKVIGSTYDHPVVAAVGWDTILCGLSLGVWAAVRGINVGDILNCSVPFYSTTQSRFKESGLEKRSLRDEIQHYLEPSEGDSSSEQKYQQDTEQDDGHTHSMTLRRRNKSTRSHAGSTVSPNSGSEESQTPGTSSSRRRERHRRGKSDTTDDADVKPSTNQSRRKPTKTKEAEEDEAYVPTPAVARSAPEGDESPLQDVDPESASLVWGLAAFGGLPSAYAGVYGGECVSR